MPPLIFAVGGVIALVILLPTGFPATDNALWVENMTPVSSSVSGHIEEIYTQNGQRLKTGDPIMLIRPAKYKLGVRRG